MFASPTDVAADMRQFFNLLPPDAAKVIQDQLQNIARPTRTTLGVGALIGAVLALWSARQGMVALMMATNIRPR